MNIFIIRSELGPWAVIAGDVLVQSDGKYCTCCTSTCQYYVYSSFYRVFLQTKTITLVFMSTTFLFHPQVRVLYPSLTPSSHCLSLTASLCAYISGMYVPDFTAYLLSDTARVVRIGIHSPEAQQVRKP